MSARLVRCPFCGRRFNVAGIEPGTQMRCSGCTAILAVPHDNLIPRVTFRIPSRAALLQIGAGLAAGLIAATAAVRAFRPAPATTVETAAAIPAPSNKPAPPPPPVEKERDLRSVFIGDPLSKAKQAIFEEFGIGFILYDRVTPYLVAVEPSERSIRTSIIEDYGRRLQTLHATFRREFGDTLGLPPVEDVMMVVVLKSRDSFDRYCQQREGQTMATQVKGFYEYSRRRIVTYHDPLAPCEVLFHEGAHQLAHYYALRMNSGRPSHAVYWFQEGLAMYFEGVRRAADDRYEIDARLNQGRLPLLRQTLAEDRKNFISLEVLVGMTVDDFWTWFEKGRASATPEDTVRQAQLYYAESAAFVQFLCHRSPVHRKLFEDYFRQELSGTADKALFEKLLFRHLGIELAQLEQEFIDHIQNGLH